MQLAWNLRARLRAVDLRARENEARTGGRWRRVACSQAKNPFDTSDAVGEADTIFAEKSVNTEADAGECVQLESAVDSLKDPSTGCAASGNGALHV